MAVAGKKLLITVSTATGGTYATVAECNQGSVTISGDNIVVTAFGSTWQDRIRGLRDISIEGSGFFKSTDASGQSAIRNSLVNDTDLFVRLLMDGTTSHYVQTQAYVNSYAVSGSVDGAVEVSFSIEGSGAPTITT